MGCGKALRQIRLEKGLSLWDVAKKIGCWPTTIWRIENEQRGLKTDMLLKLCQIYGVKPEEVLRESAKGGEA